METFRTTAIFCAGSCTRYCNGLNVARMISEIPNFLSVRFAEKRHHPAKSARYYILSVRCHCESRVCRYPEYRTHLMLASRVLPRVTSRVASGSLLSPFTALICTSPTRETSDMY